jgi:hypothetical protein
VQPETSVRRLKQTSFAAPFTPQSGPRHFRAAAQPARTMRMQTSQPRVVAQPFSGVVID